MSQMTDVCRGKPDFAHFLCVANHFANVGPVKEAEEFLRNIPELDEDLSSESLLWASLLGLCRFNRDVSLGGQIAK